MKGYRRAIRKSYKSSDSWNRRNFGIIILYDKFVNVNIFRWVQERMGWVIIN